MKTKSLVRLCIASGLSIVGVAANAADYADVAAAQTAVTGVPTQVSPVYLGFLTLSVGAFIIGMIIRFARRGSSAR